MYQGSCATAGRYTYQLNMTTHAYGKVKNVQKQPFCSFDCTIMHSSTIRDITLMVVISQINPKH